MYIGWLLNTDEKDESGKTEKVDLFALSEAFLE